ncbi:MAG: response regulator [Rubrivivax sp.]|nr:MAG: response regulator [Rubrivivax sp.]
MTTHSHLLLVEDDPSQVALAVTIFDLAGWTFKVVRDGVAAVEACKDEQFDLILMDFNLPKLNGAEATLEIRRWEKSQLQEPVLIIGVTARAMPSDIQICRSSGMDQVITKPYDIDLLLMHLDRLRNAGDRPDTEVQAVSSNSR